MVRSSNVFLLLPTFLGALRQTLGNGDLDSTQAGEGALLPVLDYLQSDALKNSPPQRLRPIPPSQGETDHE